MDPEFYLILNASELDEELENAVFEAGFDDSSLTIRGAKAAIWILHRQGSLEVLIREALKQAQQGGLEVIHVEITKESVE